MWLHRKTSKRCSTKGSSAYSSPDEIVDILSDSIRCADWLAPRLRRGATRISSLPFSQCIAPSATLASSLLCPQYTSRVAAASIIITFLSGACKALVVDNHIQAHREDTNTCTDDDCPIGEGIVDLATAAARSAMQGALGFVYGDSTAHGITAALELAIRAERGWVRSQSESGLASGGESTAASRQEGGGTHAPQVEGVITATSEPAAQVSPKGI